MGGVFTICTVIEEVASYLFPQYTRPPMRGQDNLRTHPIVCGVGAGVGAWTMLSVFRQPALAKALVFGGAMTGTDYYIEQSGFYEEHALTVEGAIKFDPKRDRTKAQGKQDE